MTSKKQTASIKYQVRETIRPTVAPLTTAIGAALAAGTLQAATITVTTLDGGLIGGECSLRSALYSATMNAAYQACPSGDAGGDILEFDSALEGTINLEAAQGLDLYYDGSTLPIGERLRIYGDGRITINGSGNAPVLYGKYQVGEFDAESISLHGLVITGGGGNYGGGILLGNQFLTITDSVLTGNSASISGGAIWQRRDGLSAQGQIDIRRSEISGNQSLDTNGGGGAIYAGSRAQIVKVNESEIFYNASLGSGGAIQFGASRIGALRVYNTDFSNNTAKYGSGGAIELNLDRPGESARSSVRIHNSKFIGNDTSENGGALALSDTGSEFTDDENISIRSSSE